jgi:hypothetical protein
VCITALDLVGFDVGEVLGFAGLSISSVDNVSTDVVSLSEALNIAANTSFTITASTGTVGIDALTLEVVPEPAAMNLLLLGMDTFVLTGARRRR